MKTDLSRDAEGRFRNADSRPRVHIWRHGHNVQWSFGRNGAAHPAESPGLALERAIETVKGEQLVVFWDGDR